MTPEWPDELDALIAAPRHHLLLMENESVRVLDTRVPPGETFHSTLTAGRACFTS
jgi:hypothetical protein